MNCCVCYEPYKRFINPPKKIVPCNHNICEVCLNAWQSSNNTCPLCRQIIQTSVLDNNLLNKIESSNTRLTTIKVKRMDEVMVDRSDMVIYVIDNSTSMDVEDGSIFNELNNNSIQIINRVSRWREACHKISKIAQYNIKRKMSATYYLLNPCRYNNWIEDIDMVKIDPNDKNYNDKLYILLNVLLNPDNVGGLTPLSSVTNKILNLLTNENFNSRTLICYNIITDGQPNNKQQFKRCLENLCRQYNVFLTINLCTNNNEIVEYYNDLDKVLGNEVSGLDVIDDFYSESIEIIKAGNGFITYTSDMHICRMAGCNSIIADSLDEGPLKIHHKMRLIKEILGNTDLMPHWTNRKQYLQWLHKNNKQVYSIFYRKFRPLIDENSINFAIIYEQNKNHLNEFISRNFYQILSALFIVIGLICCLL